MNTDDTPTPSKGTPSREWFEANLPGEDGLEITAGLPPTPTPRTDAEAWPDTFGYNCELVKADFARTLERELAAAQAEKSKMVDTIDLMCDEFLRIKALPNIQDEAVTFCDRAVSGIRQRVPVIQQRDDLERKLRAAQAELAELRERNERLKKGCIELNLAIDRIDYACGEPNEMEVSDYAVHQNEEAVVERVKTMLAQLRAAQEWKDLPDAVGWWWQCDARKAEKLAVVRINQSHLESVQQHGDWRPEGYPIHYMGPIPLPPPKGGQCTI